MGLGKKSRGKYIKDLSALGVCDISGFVFNHKDLVKQMEWVGNNKVWTGLLVGKPFLDVPCEQNRPPLVKDDPQPVKNPRLPTPYTDPNSPKALPNAQLMAKLNSFHWGS